MVCAACCNMALVLAIMHLYNVLFTIIVSVHAFSYFFFDVHKLDGMVDDTLCPSLMCSLKRGHMEGTNSSKICV